jgi:TATA-box binding protein (TBP) (component of TFIID and TFIIIB)
MMNANYIYPLPESDDGYKTWVVNIYLLRNILSSTDFVFIPIGSEVKPALIVYGAKTFMRIIVMHENTRYNFNIYSSGKLYCYGGKRQFVMDEVMKFLFGVIDRNHGRIVQMGMRTIQAKELAKLNRMQ